MKLHGREEITIEQDIETVEAKIEKDKKFGHYWLCMEEDDGPVTNALYLDEVKKLMMQTLLYGKDNKDAIIEQLFDGARDYLQSCIDEDWEDLANEINRELNNEQAHDDRERTADINASQRPIVEW